MTKLDVGCGSCVTSGYVGLDKRDYGLNTVLDVREGLPYDDDSIEAIRAAHFIEHLTQDEAMAFLNECWRVLQPDGEITLSIPHAQKSEGAFVFGHRSYYTERTFRDLERDYWESHGIRRWEILSIQTNRRGDIHCKMWPAKEMYYWPYLKQTEPRGKKLAALISPFVASLRGWQTVLDCACGYAPLYPYLARCDDYCGFDNHSSVISWLRENRLCGRWVEKDISQFHPEKPVDMLLGLGLGTGKKPYDVKNEAGEYLRLIDECKPKIIVLETIAGNNGVIDAIEPGGYSLKCRATYDAELAQNNNRMVKIYVRQRDGKNHT